MQIKKLFILLFFLIAGQARASEPVDSLLKQAEVFYTKGVVFGRSGVLDSALYYTQKAVNLCELNNNTDTTLLANSYLSMGIINKLLGKYEDAIAYYNKAEIIYKKTNNQQLLAYVYGNMANIYFIQQDYSKAKDFHFIAIDIFKRDSLNYKNQLASTYNNIGNIFRVSGKYDEAIKFYNKSLIVKEKSNFNFTVFGNLAICYEKIDDLYNSNFFYKKAINEIINKYSQNNLWLAQQYKSYANFLSSNNQIDNSQRYYKLSLTIYKNNYGNKHPDLSDCYNKIGEFYLKNNQIDSALFYFQKSLIAISPEFNNSDIKSNPEIDNTLSKTHLLSALKNKALALSRLASTENNIDYFKLSLNTYDKAIETINRIRSGYISEESKLFLAENENETFSNAFQTCFNLYKQTNLNEYLNKAFYYSEVGKSAILTEALKNSEALNIGGIPDSLISKEKKLEKSIWSYEELIYEENKKKDPDQNKLNYWNKYLFEQKQLYNDLANYLEKNFKNYYALKHSKNSFSIQELQNKLSGNDVFIEYFLASEKLFAFFINRKESILTEQNIDSLFQWHLEKLLISLSNNNFSNHCYSDFEQYQESSFYLYNKLLGPFENKLNNKNIIIIPDGKLAYLPFDVLTFENKHFDKINYKGLPYLVYKNTFNYSYSASFLFENNRTRKIAKKELAAFAPEYHSPELLRNDSLSFRQQYREMLFPLKGIKEEAQKISEIIGGDEYLDLEANESKFKEVAPLYDILHLAMHTIMDDKNPMYSKMAFSQTQNDKEDGFLNTYELYNMKLNSRMAVLSSCNSGSGKLQRGEGVLSLARGFVYAGCPSIVMTLWSVEDKSGVKLMTEFYKNLVRGKTKSESLQKSKIDFIQNADQLKAHPYFWSGYVVIGNNEPLFKSRIRYIYTGLILLIFIIVGFFGIRKFNSKS